MLSCEMPGVKDFEALAEPAAEAEAGHGGRATAFVASTMHGFVVKSLSPCLSVPGASRLWLPKGLNCLGYRVELRS